MRQSLEKLKTRVNWLGGDIEAKDIELRGILREILALLDHALPIEVEND